MFVSQRDPDVQVAHASGLHPEPRFNGHHPPGQEEEGPVHGHGAGQVGHERRVEMIDVTSIASARWRRSSSACDVTTSLRSDAFVDSFFSVSSLFQREKEVLGTFPPIEATVWKKQLANVLLVKRNTKVGIEQAGP